MRLPFPSHRVTAKDWVRKVNGPLLYHTTEKIEYKNIVVGSQIGNAQVKSRE